MLPEILAATDVPELAQYGVLGLVLLAILTGHLVPGWAYKESRERTLAAEERERRQRDTFEGQVMPALGEAAATMKEATITMRELAVPRKRA